MYGLSAAIGDIQRFRHSKKLVAYLGLNPSVCQSGNFEGSTALKRHGKGPLRALLVQAANPERFRDSKSITRSKSGASPWPPAAAATKPPSPWHESSASPSGISSTAIPSAPWNRCNASK